MYTCLSVGKLGNIDAVRRVRALGDMPRALAPSKRFVVNGEPLDLSPAEAECLERQGFVLASETEGSVRVRLWAALESLDRAVVNLQRTRDGIRSVIDEITYGPSRD